MLIDRLHLPIILKERYYANIFMFIRNEISTVEIGDLVCYPGNNVLIKEKGNS